LEPGKSFDQFWDQRPTLFSNIAGRPAGAHDVDEAMLFCSRALGNIRPGSDIDIAVRGKNLSVRAAVDLSTLLNKKIPLPYPSTSSIMTP
jgi:predicted nucleotidyltransferase